MLILTPTLKKRKYHGALTSAWQKGYGEDCSSAVHEPRGVPSFLCPTFTVFLAEMSQKLWRLVTEGSSHGITWNSMEEALWGALQCVLERHPQLSQGCQQPWLILCACSPKRLLRRKGGWAVRSKSHVIFVALRALAYIPVSLCYV